ncbi:hypothetical protein L9F63_017073, partial [Diploptera punctata]
PPKSELDAGNIVQYVNDKGVNIQEILPLRRGRKTRINQERLDSKVKRVQNTTSRSVALTTANATTTSQGYEYDLVSFIHIKATVEVKSDNLPSFSIL